MANTSINILHHYISQFMKFLPFSFDDVIQRTLIVYIARPDISLTHLIQNLTVTTLWLSLPKCNDVTKSIQNMLSLTIKLFHYCWFSKTF